MLKRYNDSQISPCIVSVVKKVLGLPNRYKDNTIKCSYKYWVEAVDIISNYHQLNLSSVEKQRAYDQFKSYKK